MDRGQEGRGAALHDPGDGGWIGMEVTQGCPVQAISPSWERGCCAHSRVLGLAGSPALVCMPREAAEPPRRPQPGSGLRVTLAARMLLPRSLLKVMGLFWWLHQPLHVTIPRSALKVTLARGLLTPPV